MPQAAAPQLRFAVLSTDVLVFAWRQGELVVRCINVNRPPHFVHQPGLPGGLIKPSETAIQAAVRCLQDKGGLNPQHAFLEQLYTFSEVDRDPRGRVVSVAYLACVVWDQLSPTEQADTADHFWLPVRALKKLAYDHDQIVVTGVQRLQSKIKYTTLLAKLLPKYFTLTDLQNAYETILGEAIDKRNFRKKILQLKCLKETGKTLGNRRARPAALYSFASSKVIDLNMMNVKGLV